MKLKEFNKNLEKLEEYSLGGTDQTSLKPLGQQTATKYRQNTDRAIVNQRSRQELYKESDINKVLPQIEAAFEMIMGAAYNTKVGGADLGQWLASKLNPIRNQLYKKVEQEQKKQK